MVTIVFLNQKGGVGKTSTTHHLAGTLAKSGYRVLLVDNDPQSSLTQGFFGPKETNLIPVERTIFACYAGDLPDLGDLVRVSPCNGVDIVPGSQHAADFNIPRPHALGYEQRHCLRDLLHGATGYDFTLIDCPPNLQLCSWAAMVAADGLVVPLQAEDYGAQGIAHVRESVERVRSTDNPGLKTFGYLITMFHARKTLHKVFEGTLREAYGETVFRTAVPNSIDFPEAIFQRQTIADYKPKGTSAKAMKAVADELILRVADAQRAGEAA